MISHSESAIRSLSEGARGRRIAMVCAHTSPLAEPGGREAGGMNVYVRELSLELAARGHAIDVYTRRSSPADPVVQPFGPNARVISIDAGPPANIDKLAVAGHLRALEDGIAAFAARERVAYDLVHSHYWLSGAVGVRLARRWRAPHVVMFHTLGEVKNRARAAEREPQARIDAERRIAAAADGIVVASEHERDLLVRLYGAREDAIAVVPCGVDLDLFTPMEKEAARRRLGLRDGERIIIFVGRIEPLKGIDVLIRAAAQLHEDENFYVLIVGGDEQAQAEVAQLKALAARLDVDHHISFVGAVAHGQLPLY